MRPSAAPCSHVLSRLVQTAAAAALLTACAAALASPARIRMRFDDGWRFYRGDAGYLPPGIAITQWRWRQAAADEAAPENADGAEWQAARSGDDVFHGRIGFAWMVTTLPNAAGADHWIHFEHVDDNGTVFLNGRRLLHHEGWSDPFDVNLQAAWRDRGPNRLAVLVENTDGPGGITGAVTLETQSMDRVEGPAAPAYNDSSWTPVHLPNDYIVEGTFDPTADGSHGFLPKMVGWYRKTFTLPSSDRGRVLWLEFDGVYRDSRMWLNGHLLGVHPSGYTSFYYNITPYAHVDARNVLSVRVDPTSNEGWWYEGGGIYRHVYLTSLAPVHIAHWGTFVSPTVEGGDTGPHERAAIHIETRIRNDTPQHAKFQIEYRILSPSGSAVAHGETGATAPPQNSAKVITVLGPLSHPALWSIETPQLYDLRTTVLQDGKVVDETDTPFGIRTFHFDPNLGFFLNGKPVKIQGTCNHQDFAGIGIALPDAVHAYKIRLLKQMGANAYRCSHHPYAPELMDDCDRAGMLVMDENRHLGDSPEVLGEVASMVERDRNHPSIVMWSMCNEEGLQGTERGARMFSAMKQEVEKLDGTRPVTCAMNGGWGHGISLVEDLQGCNYNYQDYDAFHSAFPNQPMYASETASTVTDRGIYRNDAAAGHLSSYNLTEDSWKPVADRPWMAGSFIWTGFDYRGEPTPYGWPCVNSHFGVMDTCGFPKDNYYYYRAVWREQPSLHIFPPWNQQGQEGKPIRVICFSNCDRVELSLNGKDLGSQEMPANGHLEWSVPYVPGRLVATGYRNGAAVASEVDETTGPPAAIRLLPDRVKLLNDGEDVSIIRVSVVDSEGRVVPGASNMVRFRIQGEGSIDGVGNGDPSCHEPDKASRRSAFNGRCLVVVQATDAPGEIRLTASSPGLRAAGVTLTTGGATER